MTKTRQTMGSLDIGREHSIVVIVPILVNSFFSGLCRKFLRSYCLHTSVLLFTSNSLEFRLQQIDSGLGLLPFDAGQLDAHLPGLTTNSLLFVNFSKNSSDVILAQSVGLVEESFQLEAPLLQV